MKQILFALMVLVTVGCTRVGQGEFGILQHFSGSIDDQAAGPGFNMTVLDSIIKVDGTEVRVPMHDLTPKDRDGVLFTIDLTVTYKVNPDKGIAFYKQTHEIDRVKQNDDYENTLGFKIMEDTVSNSINKAFQGFAVSEIGARRSEIEDGMKKILQEKIDSRYADAFSVVNVNINRTKLGDAVEAVLQSQAIAKSQRVLIELQQQLADKENDLISKKIEGLKRVSTKTGVTTEKLMQFKLHEQYNGVLSELAKNHSETQVQVQGAAKED